MITPGNSPANTPEAMQQVKESIGSLTEVPAKLREIIPQSVWATLNAEQRMDMLKQHGLLEEYTPSQPELTQEPTQEASVQAVQEQAPAVVDAQIEAAPPAETVEFQQAVEAAREVERNAEVAQEQPVQQSPVDVPAQEQIANVSTGSKDLSGYTPSESLVNNVKQVAENGSVNEASTWTATLLQKIWAVLSGQ